MDADLSRMVSERCGCEVDASFIRRKEFRFAWGTHDGLPVIQISDYLRDAPDQVLTDFGEMLVRRSRKQRTAMPASFCEYVATDGFVISRRPTYIDRSRNLLRTDIGDHAFIPARGSNLTISYPTLRLRSPISCLQAPSWVRIASTSIPKYLA